MKNIDDLQVQLFKKINSERSQNSGSLVNEIMSLLSVGSDSAYRRIRGETPLTLSELVKINTAYDLSVKDFLTVKDNAVLFDYNWPQADQFQYTLFLEYMHHDMSRLSHGDKNALLSFNSKDLPTFYFFLFPEISAFKGFFWERTFFKSDELKYKRFDFSQIKDRNTELGYEILKTYKNIESIELWSDVIINSTLNQISFYSESEVMDKSTTKVLLEKMDLLVNHLQTQTECGFKFLPGEDTTNLKPNLKVYYNEVLIGDNAIMYNSENHKIVYISRNVISALVSTNRTFFEHTWQLQESIINQSTLISQSAAKERDKLFNGLRRKVEELRVKLFI